MTEFLETHGSEVSNLLLEEWNMDEALKDAREEGRDEGRKQGREEAKQELIRALNGVLIPEVIAEKFGLPVNYVLDVLGDMKP